MHFSAVVLLFRILKIIRIQDNLPKRPQRYLFAVACIASAYECDNNSQGKPLFFKSLLKATFIAQNFVELQPDTSNPADSIGVLPYEQWNEMFFDYLVQMKNSCI